MVVRIIELVPSADTWEQGSIVLAAIKKELQSEETIEISFREIYTATSSFANSAFGQLTQEMSLDEIKKRVRIVNSTRQINEMIKLCLERNASGPSS